MMTKDSGFRLDSVGEDLPVISKKDSEKHMASIGQKGCILKAKPDVIASEQDVVDLLSGTIESSQNDDLCYERDRLIGLLQNVNLETTSYRRAVEALSAANDEIEKLVGAKS
jgi:hypothetical protein